MLWVSPAPKRANLFIFIMRYDIQISIVSASSLARHVTEPKPLFESTRINALLECKSKKVSFFYFSCAWERNQIQLCHPSAAETIRKDAGHSPSAVELTSFAISPISKMELGGSPCRKNNSFGDERRADKEIVIIWRPWWIVHHRGEFFPHRLAFNIDPLILMKWQHLIWFLERYWAVPRRINLEQTFNYHCIIRFVGTPTSGK